MNEATSASQPTNEGDESQPRRIHEVRGEPGNYHFADGKREAARVKYFGTIDLHGDAPPTTDQVRLRIVSALSRKISRKIVGFTVFPDSETQYEGRWKIRLYTASAATTQVAPTGHA
ncbi:MAG: hypothetical protein HY983_02720 [Candidatus Magasanikbacteria bacterium]|nr:hypothetical protein [Candidatus Magasanikbacteria bacterium]